MDKRWFRGLCCVPLGKLAYEVYFVHAVPTIHHPAPWMYINSITRSHALVQLPGDHLPQRSIVNQRRETKEKKKHIIYLELFLFYFCTGGNPRADHSSILFSFLLSPHRTVLVNGSSETNRESSLAAVALCASYLISMAEGCDGGMIRANGYLRFKGTMYTIQAAACDCTPAQQSYDISHPHTTHFEVELNRAER
ncbi:uncharacterized protein MCYG_03001 [Microsporum canis CBS 113480]|uniref:Uncharacterized protein n=1 Tax=Arthroderma otae (strain ATCC MYA-4605 / CBS 113480) TaxID=554155 RepID=C5FKG0_ARTOC|nr:uncharacterized protein MCYG_03001 [Microsporum canis CBS 113480]EEQ30182.1 predicted protein [Microsporum canis CBS 113480]